MSAQRLVAPLTSSSNILFRFTSAPARSRQPCQHVLRAFSSANPARMSSKRKMQTSTAYHPSSLDTNLPPPPRNASIPNTSIAGTIPQVNDTRPPEASRGGERSFGESPHVIVTEQEAQKSKPVTTPASSATETSQQPRAKPRPKLRPRKAAMNLTPTAVKQLRAMLDQPSPKLIKVGVRNRGCSGLAYHLEYVDKPGTFDEMVEQDGVKVLIDSKALFSIIGSEMDWVEDKLNQRFVFKNPNISNQPTFNGFGRSQLTLIQRNNAGAGSRLWYRHVIS
jgi:iron-sulfur cluster assembly 1